MTIVKNQEYFADYYTDKPNKTKKFEVDYHQSWYEIGVPSKIFTKKGFFLY